MPTTRRVFRDFSLPGPASRAALWIPDWSGGAHGRPPRFWRADRRQSFDRTIDPARDLEPIAQALEQWMPGAAKTLREATPCMYTLTPDEHFVIDRIPSMQTLSYVAASPATGSSSRRS